MPRSFLGLLALVVFLTGFSGCAGTNPNVTMHHNDAGRTGAYLAETTLTPATVRARGMHVKYWIPPCHNPVANPWSRPDVWDGPGPFPADLWHRPSPPTKIASGCLDGVILTQPLYVRNVAFEHSRTANSVFVGTGTNYFYAFEAESGDEMWKTDLMAGDDLPRCDIDPHAFKITMCFIPVGVHATPVIDAAGGFVYVLYSSRWQDREAEQCIMTGNLTQAPPDQVADCAYIEFLSTHARVEYRLAKLDLMSGRVLRKISISASVVQRDGVGVIKFVGHDQLDHPALLLDHGSVYIAFGSVAFLEASSKYQYHGWAMRYRADNLALQYIFCTSPDPPTRANPNAQLRDAGSGIWQGGGGLAADSDGYVYFLTGNGRSGSDGISGVRYTYFGDSFVRIPPQRSSLFGGFFGAQFPVAYAPTTPTTDNADVMEIADSDLGAGGTMLIPDTHLVIGGGKTGYIYVLNRDTMTPVQDVFAASTNQYDPTKREGAFDGPHLHGSPTYWQGPADSPYGFLYVWGEKDFLNQYRFNKKAGKFEAIGFIRPDGTVSPPVVKPNSAKVKALPDTMPGGMLSLSANGTQKDSGIVWATLPDSECAPTPTEPCNPPPPSNHLPGWLYAFHAETLEPLWDGGFGWLISHWVPPTVANGMVFIPSGSEFAEWPGKTEMLMAFELGAVNGSERKQGETHQPVKRQASYSCNFCHSSEKDLQELIRSHPMRERFANNASMRTLPVFCFRMVAPPAGHSRKAILEGNGQQIYVAEQIKEKLVWRAKDTTADLSEVAVSEEGGKNSMPLHVRLSEGLVWTASDGSMLQSEVQKEVVAPGTSDNTWALFKITKHVGRGVLDKCDFISRVYTHAGLAPAAPPRKIGEVAKVPYHAQFWLYSEERQAEGARSR
jgi:hypothetical protein